jgi:hypothetical protein
MFVSQIFKFILFLSIVLFSTLSYSQRFLGVLSAGMNLSQVDGDEVYGFKKVGLNIGPSVIFPFGKDKKWSITLELLYSQQGSRQKNTTAPTDTVADSSYAGYYDGYRLSLNYIQVPLIVHFTDKRIIAGGIGFSYSRLVGVSEYESYDDPRGFVKTQTSLSGPYLKSDFQVLGDVRLRIWQKLWLNVRYSYSMFPLRTRRYSVPIPNGVNEWSRHQYNNVITFRLVYIFNDLMPDKRKKRPVENE